MNSKQRVLTALTRRGLPDRVPLQFDLSRALADQFSARYAIPTHYTTAYYEDVTYRLSNNDLRLAMGSDCVIVGAGLPRGYQHPVEANGFITNDMSIRSAHLFDNFEIVDFGKRACRDSNAEPTD